MIYLKGIENEWYHYFYKSIKIILGNRLDYKSFTSNSNVTMDVIKKNPYDNWDYDSLVSNPNISLNDVLKNPHIPWNWNKVNEFLTLSVDDILEHPELSWNWNLLSKNTKIPIEQICQNQQLPWNWKIICSCNFIPSETLITYPDCPWDFFLLSRLKFSKEVYEKYIDNEWNWNFLHTYNNVIPWSFIKHNVEKFPDFYAFSDHEDIEIDFVVKWHRKGWFWRSITKNPKVTYDVVINNIDISWDWNQLKLNPNFTIEQVYTIYEAAFNKGHRIQIHPTVKELEKIPQFIIGIHSLIINKDVTVDFLRKYAPKITLLNIPMPNLTRELMNIDQQIVFNCIDEGIDMEWNWRHISMEVKPTTEIIRKYANHWDWIALSYNPNVTLKMIEYLIYLPWHFDSINWNTLSIDFIKKHIDKSWNWFDLTDFDQITTDFICDNIDRQWNWEKISEVKDINLKLLELCKYKSLDMQKIFIESSGRKSFKTDKDNFIHEKCFQMHQTSMKNVLSEMKEVLYQPDNIQFMKDVNLISYVK